MRERQKKQNKSYKVNSRPIVSLLIGLGFLSAILLVTMLSSNANKRNIGTVGSVETMETDAAQLEQDDLEEKASDRDILGVVTQVDMDQNQITLFDVKKEESTVYQYTGGTSITDKYGKVMAMSQIQIGTMVDASIGLDKNKLTDLKISTKAWEYVGVLNLNVDRSNRVMKIVSSKYKYTKDIIILDGQEFIPVANLAEQDELTIWGYEETIWSIIVTRGHGTVKLADYESFLGDNITIGYEAMVQVDKDLAITVQEGNFNLTVENGEYTATKNITIYRNKETVVSLSDLGPAASKQSRVTFDITPFGADLYVDGDIMSYASPIELTYGKHAIVVSLDGYTTYDGSLTVNTAGKTLKIDLPEDTSEDAVAISETDTETDSETSTDTDITPGTTEVTGDDEETTGGSNTTKDGKHQIYVQNPVGASVYIDGEFMCIAPGNFNKITGSHVITFIKEGFETMSYTIEVLDDGLDTYFNMPDLVKTAE